MKIHNDLLPITKIHNSVQSMLAEARRIVRPTKNQASSYVSNNSHFQIHLPTTHMSQDLKEILHLSSQSYRKIDRKRRLSLVKIEDNQASQQNLSVSSKPISINRLNNRQQLQGVINNFQSQLIDKKFHQSIKKNKRLLYNKKAIHFLPQIQSDFSPSKSKSQSTRQEESSLLERYRIANQRLTQLKKDKHAKEINQTKQYKTIEVPQQKKIEVLVLSTITVPNESRLMKKYPKPKNPSVKKISKANQKKQVHEEVKYTPWDLQPQQPEVIF